jgi:hypothetical protein
MVSGKSPEVRFGKTKMCKFHIQGKCAKGTNCSFAHGCDEMETSPDLYRTQLCMALFKTGKCKDSENCKYAHTREQLRALPGGSDKIDKVSHGKSNNRLTTHKHTGQNQSGNTNTTLPKHSPTSRTTTPPNSPPPPPAVAPGVWLAAVPIPILHLPVGMDVTADGHLIMGSPSGIGSSPMAAMPITGVVTNTYGIPWNPNTIYNTPYSAFEELRRVDTPPVVNHNKIHCKGTNGGRLTGKPWNLMVDEAADDVDRFMLTETLSEISTDRSEDRDKSSADGDSFDSLASSMYVEMYSLPVPVPAFEQGFEVSIKNTFLDIAQKTPTRRASQSVPRKLSGTFTFEAPLQPTAAA